MPTPLDLYLTSTNSTGTLSSTARKLQVSAPSVGTKVNVSIGTGVNWGELGSRGGSWVPNTSEQPPSGNGWILDDTSMEGQRLAAGTYNAYLALAINSFSSTLGLNVYARLYKRSSGGTYTQIARTTGSSVTLGISVSYLSLSYTTSSPTDLASGDKLYVDVMAAVTSASSDSGTIIYVYENSGTFQSIHTPGYDIIPYFSGAVAITGKKPTVAVTALNQSIGTAAITGKKPVPSVSALERFLGAAGFNSKKPTVQSSATTTLVASVSVQGKKPTIAGFSTTQLRITTNYIIPFPVGSSFSQQLERAGGVGPFTWEQADPALVGEWVPGDTSSLPSGLSISSSGLISGTPSSAESTVFYVRVIDATGATAVARYIVSVSNDVAGPIVISGKKPTVAGAASLAFPSIGSIQGKKPTVAAFGGQNFSGTVSLVSQKPVIQAGQLPIGPAEIMGKKPGVDSTGYVSVVTPVPSGLRFVNTARVGITL